MLLLIYSSTLLAAVLLSERFARTVLSAAVLFLVVGYLTGIGGTTINADDPLVGSLSDAALVTILFTDGMRIGWAELKGTWRLPGRALLLGLPLTLAGTAAVAHWLLGLAWHDALLVGAILSPTDPVFASAIVGRKEVPERVRRLLNVESGLNDGLALPIVIILLRAAAGSDFDFGGLLRETIGGVALGASIGSAAGHMRRWPMFRVAENNAALHGLAILLIVYAAAQALSLNTYLAAFSAGVALVSIRPSAADEFRAIGEPVSELLKLAAIFVFAVMLSAHQISRFGLDVLFAVVVLTLVRTAAIGLALAGSELPRRERMTAAWFGPRGFASVIYGLMLLSSSVSRRGELFDIIALVVVTSMVLHSSTDVPVAHYFRRLQRTDR
jgi:NhaP-type Na+/H+ or K+/H+ antiporter